MNNGFKKRLNLNRLYSFDITICEEKQTVITELITRKEEPILVYAEKFDKPCNYLKAGIRGGFEYLIASTETRK